MPSVVENTIEAETDAVRVRLKRLRTLKGWTLEEAAGRAGLSKSFLSRLEEGQRQASVAALLSLAKAYGITIASLFEAAPDTESCTIIRSGSSGIRQTNGLLYSTLSSKTRPSNLHALRITVSPDREGDELFRHDDEEWLYVLKGDLKLMLGGTAYTLAPGDAAHFDARNPHRLVALNGADVDVLLIACAAPRGGATFF